MDSPFRTSHITEYMDASGVRRIVRDSGNARMHFHSGNESSLERRRRSRLMQLLEQSHESDLQADPVPSSDGSSEGEPDEDKSSDSTSSSDDEKKKKKKKKVKKDKKRAPVAKAAPTSLTANGIIDANQLAALFAALAKSSSTGTTATPTSSALPESISSDPLQPPPAAPATSPASAAEIAQQVVRLLKQEEQAQQNKDAPTKSGSKVAFKRVDQVYDRKIHNYKLKETVQADPQHDKWDQYVFNVRRSFDPASHYIATLVDIKSKYLRDCLKDVMGEIKGVNLVAEKPSIDPNMLFLHLEELRTLQKELATKAEALKGDKDKQERKTAKRASQHLKVLIEYLDEDYEDTKKALYPMLEAGIITFDYLWALFKPNTILYSSTYGDEEEPRACKTVYSKESRSFTKGVTYDIEGRYLEYDGKNFGLASVHLEVGSFSGARKISSLPCYPLRYHKTPDETRERLIERGKKFISLQGMKYQTYHGMTYMKKEEKVLKVDVNGRIMVDPAIFRRVNPNYPVSYVKVVDGEVDELGLLRESTDRTSNTTLSESQGQPTPASEDFEKHKHFKVVKNEAGQHIIVEVASDEAAQAATNDTLHEVFDEEQLLIASSVVIGFSFSEKLWLEFAVSKIGEIQWNTNAFDSLILPDNQKSIVKALVSSHAFHPSRSIDDIIAGKGKGLVAVLHGGPGLGKTLTVESIADLLKRPLYMVSAGDLGTNSQTLERELQNILDIAHAWGAVLLLDEADVFLEKRSTHDIHRNALVSIFLRLLEYFQGILFLTTNRVEVFDEAFISRIHLSLRYGDLSVKAKKAVWVTFINKVREAEGMEVEEISDKDLDELSRRSLNGRQIKNIVRAAQALAIHEDVPLGMNHIKEVLLVAQTFERDLKGGTGYEDAMRGYT